MRTGAKIAITALAIAIAGPIFSAGTATAQETPTAAPAMTRHDERVGAFLERLAAKLGVSVEQLRQAGRDAQNETIDALVADGKLSEEQAARARMRVAAGTGVRLRAPISARGERTAARIRRGIVTTTADALGMSRGALADELRQGKSIADVASERGMALGDVTARIVADAKARLDRLVAAGSLSQGQEDGALQRLRERLDAAFARTRGAASATEEPTP